MDQAIFEKVKEKKLLIAITNKDGTVIWESNESPASMVYKAYFNGMFQELDELSIYSNQAGMALAILASKIPIKNCYACRMSEYGLKKFRNNGVHVEYEELIPLIKSSKDDNVICPIEQYLAANDNVQEQWEFLEKRFSGILEKPMSCSVKLNQK